MALQAHYFLFQQLKGVYCYLHLIDEKTQA